MLRHRNGHINPEDILLRLNNYKDNASSPKKYNIFTEERHKNHQSLSILQRILSNVRAQRLQPPSRTSHIPQKKHQQVSKNPDWPCCTITYIFLFRMLMHDLGLSRRACDRCHGQKLRCKRESNDASCVRCQRAGVRCVPRPSRSQRRIRSNTYHQVRASGSEHSVNLGVFDPLNSGCREKRLILCEKRKFDSRARQTGVCSTM